MGLQDIRRSKPQRLWRRQGYSGLLRGDGESRTGYRPKMEHLRKSAGKLRFQGCPGWPSRSCGLRQLVEPDAPHFRHGPPPPEANNEFSVRVDPRRPVGDDEELVARVAIGGIEAEAVVADP